MKRFDFSWNTSPIRRIEQDHRSLLQSTYTHTCWNVIQNISQKMSIQKLAWFLAARDFSCSPFSQRFRFNPIGLFIGESSLVGFCRDKLYTMSRAHFEYTCTAQTHNLTGNLLSSHHWTKLSTVWSYSAPLPPNCVFRGTHESLFLFQVRLLPRFSHQVNSFIRFLFTIIWNIVQWIAIVFSTIEITNSYTHTFSDVFVVNLLFKIFQNILYWNWLLIAMVPIEQWLFHRWIDSVLDIPYVPGDGVPLLAIAQSMSISATNQQKAKLQFIIGHVCS